MLNLDSVQANNVSDLKDFGMVLQLLTEDGASNLVVGLVSDLQCRTEICGRGNGSNLKHVRSATKTQGEIIFMCLF